jgi:apolipoprotein D and lipocalin family protein
MSVAPECPRIGAWPRGGWRRSRALLLAVAVLACLSACVTPGPYAELPTVPAVDIDRYQGDWYEIARLPQWFQRDCVRSQAHYAVIGAIELAVTNTCITAAGETRVATGRARVVDPISNAKLEVVFDNWFSQLLPSVASGKYWVIYLDGNYQTAIVGHPNRRYLWILARTPRIDQARYQELLAFCEARGFDTTRLVRDADPALTPAAPTPSTVEPQTVKEKP